MIRPKQHCINKYDLVEFSGEIWRVRYIANGGQGNWAALDKPNGEYKYIDLRTARKLSELEVYAIEVMNKENVK